MSRQLEAESREPIEKILRYAGFEARHVFMLSTEGSGSSVRALLTPGAASHAVTEVLTSRGWLVVESNDSRIIQLRCGDGDAFYFRFDPARNSVGVSTRIP